MGVIQSALKAQYYPTDQRIADFLTYIHFNINHETEMSIMEKDKKIIEEYIKNMQVKYKNDNNKNPIPSYTAYNFQKIINGNEDQNINDFFIRESQYRGNNSCIILDPFAGEGKLLNNYKKYDTSDRIKYKTKTIGIELVKERAEKLKENHTDKCFNNSFENIQLPDKIVSLLYFNPPYDTVDGERLTKKYLKRILDTKILLSGSYVDFIIRENDALECIDIISDYFYVDENLIFKAPEDEYNKFKQIIIVGRYIDRNIKPPNTKWEIERKQKKLLLLQNKIKNASEIDIIKIPQNSLKETRDLIYVDYDNKIKKFKIKNKTKNMISNKKNIVWNWFKENTEINDFDIKHLEIPKPFKTGEIVNVLASGYLSGEIAKNTEKNHVVVGGTEQIEEVRHKLDEYDNGKTCNKMEIERLNKPYVNILLPNGKIKKLLNKNSN